MSYKCRYVIDGSCPVETSRLIDKIHDGEAKAFRFRKDAFTLVEILYPSVINYNEYARDGIIWFSLTIEGTILEYHVPLRWSNPHRQPAPRITT